jgi:hypothetical protein
MNISDRIDRACARLSQKAKLDTIYGGCASLILAERMEKMECKVPAVDIVRDVYSRSTGMTSAKWGPWKCEECGQTHMGYDNAANCCD